MQKIDIKQILNRSIKYIASEIKLYSEHPGKDFTRNRKLPAHTLMQFMLNMEGNSLNAEIYNNFPVSEKRMTASAYEQQRDKLKPEAFKALLHGFNATLTDVKTMKGLRVYAIDGSDINFPTNKKQPMVYSESFGR